VVLKQHWEEQKRYGIKTAMALRLCITTYVRANTCFSGEVTMLLWRSSKLQGYLIVC